MALRAELNTKLKEAMKNKDNTAVSTLRLILAALKDRDIAARAKGDSDGVEEPEILSMLQTMIKQRKESVETYRKAEREDLAEREEAEIVIIEKFLPSQLSDEEVSVIIDGLIAETGAESIRDMGKIMGGLKAKYAGQLDMGRASAIIKEKLG